MLTPNLLELFGDQWLGTVDAATAHGCDLICFCGRSLGDPGFGKQANAIYDLATGETLDGVILWTSSLAIHVGDKGMELFHRRFAGLPMVSVEQRIGQAPLVLMENRRGMDAAVSHLIEVHGRRRVGFVRGPANHQGAQERYQGYLDALARHGLRPRPEWVSPPSRSWIPEGAFASVARMLRCAERPDAIAAANDDFAVGTLSALSASGVLMPDEIAVVGYDDQLNARLHDLGFDNGIDDETVATRRTVNINAQTLSLTTIRAPFVEMGRRSLETVLDLIHGKTVAPVVEVPTQLVVRRSCGCSPAASLRATGSTDAEPPEQRLRTLLPATTDERPSDWPTQLLQAFANDMRGEPGGGFLRLLDSLVHRSLRSGESADSWWRTLFDLWPLYSPSCAEERERADDLRLQAQMLLAQNTERHWRYLHVLTDKLNHVVHEVGQQLISAPDVRSLAEVLADELPKVGIPSCHVALYETNPTARDAKSHELTARLVLAYEDREQTEIATASRTFPAVQLVPDGRLFRTTPRSTVAAPLYFNDQQLGHVLFEVGPRIGWIYSVLHEQLSNAVHTTLIAKNTPSAGPRRLDR